MIATASVNRREQIALTTMAASGVIAAAWILMEPGYRLPVLRMLTLIWLVVSIYAASSGHMTRLTLKQIYSAARRGELRTSWSVKLMHLAAWAMVISAVALGAYTP